MRACARSFYSSRPGKEPIRNLRDDLHRLGWRLDDAALKFLNDRGEIACDPTNIRVLQYNVREAYRAALLIDLESSSSSWTGSSHALPGLSSALHKKWKERPNRLILERLLTNAHCTPYRLFLMQKRDSPQCPYCAHDRADAAHILYDCSYFEHLRTDAPSAVGSQASWPQCSRAYLLYFAQLPPDAKAVWIDIQAWACQLFALWYHAERQLNAPEEKGLPPNDASVLDFAPSTAPPLNPVDTIDPTARRTFSAPTSNRLHIKWALFTSRAQWSLWKGFPLAFAQLFLYWSTWRPAHGTANEIRYTTWHEALCSLSPTRWLQLQGVIRRWKLAAASCEHSGKNLHVVLPFWETDQWTCVGCNRPANLTRDPASYSEIVG